MYTYLSNYNILTLQGFKQYSVIKDYGIIIEYHFAYLYALYTRIAKMHTYILYSVYITLCVRTQQLLILRTHIPYNGNHPWKKTFANYLPCHSPQENFRDSGNLIYKNSGRDKKCKKTFTNASRFVKFTKLFFHGWFPLYGSTCM